MEETYINDTTNPYMIQGSSEQVNDSVSRKEVYDVLTDK